MWGCGNSPFNNALTGVNASCKGIPCISSWWVLGMTGTSQEHRYRKQTCCLSLVHVAFYPPVNWHKCEELTICRSFLRGKPLAFHMFGSVYPRMWGYPLPELVDKKQQHGISVWFFHSKSWTPGNSRDTYHQYLSSMTSWKKNVPIFLGTPKKEKTKHH